jgi:hypothetical protein
MGELRWATTVLLISGLLFGGIAPAHAQGLPPEADKVIKDYEAFEAQAKKKMEDELLSQHNQAVADLQAMQDSLTKKGDLDGALAVRNAINQMKVMQKLKGKPILPDPGTLASYEQAKPGDEVVFKVTGKTSGGSVWGTDLYTLDSKLALAAVHAGVLKAGQEGIIRVVFAPGLASYTASEKNGVKTSSWSGYKMSYKVEAVTP